MASYYFADFGKLEFGAPPLHSAIDLTTCLPHDVEEVLSNNLKETLLSMSVKGGF